MDWTAWDQRQRERQGARYFPEPRGEHYGKLMWCKWCGHPIPEVIDGKRSTQRLWHPECKVEFFLHTRLGPQFDFLVGRDGERCAWPGCGATPQKWMRGDVYCHTANSIRRSCLASAPDMVEWAAILWDAPEKPWAEQTEEERQIGAQQTLDYRASALEVDHRVPLWAVADLPDEERRWYFGPGNLWLLCKPHHLAKSKQEAGLRARLRKGEAAIHFAESPRPLDRPDEGPASA